ncbi:hypothetical protein N0V83_009388 [Neocucurbitaria cava]|uniref:SnoaL-like domain-containing protein n=1 Tax=Neocucurbitaria cava TaxID=798079 RepID=A0A9W9CIF6_9PLEO|nr:hypothetical protein N0V83_009388 [Neocucurbitaria cava]
MHGTPLPSKLAGPPLSDREAVADACFRAFASIDHAEESLLKSSCTADIYTDIASKVCNGYDELKTKVWENVATKLDTVHYLTNMRVSVDTPTTARGYDPESGKFTTGAIYNCDAVKEDDDVWKLKTMKSSHVWGEGDPSIMAGH